MFEDVEFFRRSAKEKLDLFEEQNEDPSFINYAMLEVKDGDPDIIFVGEHVVNEITSLAELIKEADTEEHKN